MSCILVVEDQSDIRRLIRWSLDAEGHEIHEASNGQTGLTGASLVKPDLILLDVMMPGEIDGLEVCRRVKAGSEYGRPLVLLLIALAQKRDREAGLAAGADGYISKPFSPAQLVQQVESLLKSRQSA
jgi:DNA-binding response OmpR family regulator